MENKVTPIRAQYLEIKKQYPDAIVFFRLGDFYETFDQDAEITSRDLDIVLTSRNIGKNQRIPMAGIPYHAIENYLSRLIEKGHHVAICEQVGEQPKKGLFPRKVVRVVTPGTIFEPGLLQEHRNNYLMALSIAEQKCGIAFVDITTGEFSVTEIKSNAIQSRIRDEIVRLKPAEILIPQSFELDNGHTTHTTSWPDWRFETTRCVDELKKHFQVSILDGFGLREKSVSVQAAGAILQYIKETQPAALKLLDNLSTYSLAEFMTLDATTRRNLELTETLRDGSLKGSLLSELDFSITPMGKRLLRQWVSKPLLNIDKINERLDAVETFLQDGILRNEFRSLLYNFGDLERLVNRVISGIAIPRDLLAIQVNLSTLPEIIKIFSSSNLILQELINQIDPCQHELELLNRSINQDSPATLQTTGIIKNGYSDELDQIVSSSQHARDWIARLEESEKQRTKIKTLKVGYNKVFGYYIEISKGNADQAPENYIRKQTLVNAERFITPELKEYETLVLNAEERIHEIEIHLFHQVCERLSKSSSKLLKIARIIGRADVLASLAEAAGIYNYVRPELNNTTELNIKDGRHPVVEHMLSGTRFIPNDSIFEDGEIIRIITGPNMSGKSTFLRQIALIVLMAQMGSFVSASSAIIGLVDRIFTRIGAQDEIHAGQSTFMVEMVETANILNHATPRSLLVLDEIGRGTSTYDGVSIAWSVVEYIHNHPSVRARTFFATHYHELTELEDLLPGIRNYNVDVAESEGKVVFLHKIKPGSADKSYGIHVAQLAGLPKPIILRAVEILQHLEASSGKTVSIREVHAQQMALFPETNPLLNEISTMDVNAVTPIEALNKLYEWKKKYQDDS
ncbi:MAG: DNA mismatch repair protein MutS [Anaerolineaceae bacterium]|nr:DNA mismatch repair protein MutS [Anaerolineaceae bacterium]